MEPAAEPEIAGEVNKEIADLIPDALPQAEAEPTTQPPISESVEVVVEEPEPVNEPTPEPVEVVEAEAPAEPVEEEEPKEEPEREFAATGPEGKGYKGAEEDSIFKRLSVGFLTTFGSGTEAKRVLAKYREPASLRKYKLDDKAEFSGGLFGKVTRTALRKRPSYRDEKTGKVRNEMPAGSKVMDIFSIADNFAKDSIKKNDDFFHLWAGDN